MTNKTEDKKVDKVSYSSIAGELRKASRLYDVFKHASEAADLLSQFSTEKELLLRDIESLKSEVVSLDKACDLSYKNREDADAEVFAAKEEAVLILKRARSDAEGIKGKASENAIKKIKEGNDALSVIIEKTRISRNEEGKAKNEKTDALNSLAKVEKQIQAAKDRFLKTLG